MPNYKLTNKEAESFSRFSLFVCLCKTYWLFDYNFLSTYYI